jgi:uncharacterized membrane protein YcgQ (UPF0703/DUF1980 family)
MEIHFILFIINIILWVAVGVAIGNFFSKGNKRSENVIVLVSAMSALFAGFMSSLTHGIWVDLGVDFFNLAAAATSSIVNLYVFQPQTRPAIANMRFIERAKNLVTKGADEIQDIEPNVFAQNFWKNITSTLNP